VTDAQFLSYYAEVMLDFLQQSGIIKTLTVVIQKFGIEEYGTPNSFGGPDHVISRGQSLFQSSESDMANASREWRSQVKQPRAWRQDKGNMRRISVFPLPSLSGNEVAVTGGVGMFGTIAAVPVQTDVNITSLGLMYGTISSDQGPVALIPSGLFFGTIAAMRCSKSNITAIGDASLFNTNPGLDTQIEWLPPSFALYVGYGILAKIFSMEGECKDDTRARYARARYDEGIALGQTIMAEAMAEEEAYA
jgi:hypothetical protein